MMFLSLKQTTLPLSVPRWSGSFQCVHLLHPKRSNFSANTHSNHKFLQLCLSTLSNSVGSDHQFPNFCVTKILMLRVHLVFELQLEQTKMDVISVYIEQTIEAQGIKLFAKSVFFCPNQKPECLVSHTPHSSAAAPPHEPVPCIWKCFMPKLTSLSNNSNWG